MRSKVFLSVAALFLMLCASGRALGCSCITPGAPCQAFGSASAVFVGTVTGSGPRQHRQGEKAGDVDWTPVVFRFTVLQPFLGVESAEVEVATGRGGGDCGYSFRKGETYLVYAYGGRDGAPLATGICTRTRPVSAASEDLEFLRGLAGRGPGVSLTITVLRRAQDVKDGGRSPESGMAGAGLVVEGAGERMEVKTDAAGRVQLSGLKPGTYKVRLLLPDELTTYKAEQEVTVADRGCANVFYGVTDNGRISGKITDVEGRAASGVQVTLVSADEADDEQQQHANYARTDDEGRYSFSALPPGRYLLAVNLVRFPQADDKTNAYPRTYYPGVALASQAEAITLGTGESVKDKDFTLPQRRADSVLSGVVVWDDGSPVVKANVSYRDVTYHDPGIDYGMQADEQGRFVIKGYQGQTLLIQARSNREFVGDLRRDGPMERGEPLRVTLASPPEPVRIVLTKIR